MGYLTNICQRMPSKQGNVDKHGLRPDIFHKLPCHKIICVLNKAVPMCAVVEQRLHCANVHHGVPMCTVVEQRLHCADVYYC